MRHTTILKVTMIFLSAIIFSVTAQAQSLTQKNQRFDTLYTQLLNDPANIDLTIEYTQLAVDLADYEAAIPPMERLLMNNPSTPKIQLELGILYQLLGSKDIARNYFNEVTASAQASDEQVAQAKDYLAQL